MSEAKVIVSLTTHSIRVKNVGKTIFSILNGTFKDVKVVLTLYKDDVNLISDDLKILIKNDIVELIVADKDLGPHLKYFYAMMKYRDLPLITIDDDVLYPLDMVEKLYSAYINDNKSIIARRCYDILTSNGNLVSYEKWLTSLTKKTWPTHKILATGIGGILYPPDCLNLSEDNIKEILEIKYDDDFYLKALEYRKDIKIRSINSDISKLYLKNMTDAETQSISLWYTVNKRRSDFALAKYKNELLGAANGN